MASVRFALVPVVQEALSQAATELGSEFTGAGIIVTDRPEALPIVPLVDEPFPRVNDLIDFLRATSRYDSPYHDGFHVLSSDGKTILASQYFAPRIRSGIWRPSKTHRGGRYVAALFGSTLPAVHFIVVASTNYGMALLVDGKEVSAP